MKRKFHPFVFGANLFVSAILITLSENVGFVIATMLRPIFPDLPTLLDTSAVIFGVLFAFGAYGLYVHSELALKSILASDAHEVEKYARIAALVLLNASIIAVDIFGVLYRSQFFTDKGAGWLVGVGIVSAFVPLLIGLVLTPIQKKPVDLLADDLADELERSVVTGSFGMLASQPLDRQRRAVAGGVTDVIEEALDEAQEQRMLRAAEKDRRRNNRNATRRQLTQALTGKPTEDDEELDTDELPDDFLDEEAVPANFPKAQRRSK